MQKVHLKIDKEKDKEIILWLSLNPTSLDGIDRFEKAIKLLPELNNLREMNIEERKKKINEVVEKVYRIENETMQKNLKEIDKLWQKKEKDFLERASQIFDNHQWPKGEFTGFITIMALFPRDLNKKTFQLPYRNTELAMQVIIHEILHFLFYDYLNKKFEDKSDEKIVWELSEILNEIVMKKEPLSNLYDGKLKTRQSLGDKTKELEKIYNKSKSMHEFIEKAIIFLKNG